MFHVSLLKFKILITKFGAKRTNKWWKLFWIMCKIQTRNRKQYLILYLFISIINLDNRNI